MLAIIIISKQNHIKMTANLNQMHLDSKAVLKEFHFS